MKCVALRNFDLGEFRITELVRIKKEIKTVLWF